MIETKYEVGKDPRLVSRRSKYIPDEIKDTKAVRKEKIVKEKTEGSQLSLLIEVVCQLADTLDTKESRELKALNTKIKAIRNGKPL